MSGRDVLTKGTADQIDQHNKTGARICSWQPHHGATHAGTDKMPP